MQIVVTRIDANRYSTLVERDEGVKLRVPGYGFMRALPHDLAHYAVESTLRLDRGFWGSVATGAKLSGMALIAGRQKPHATEQGHAIAKQNGAALSQAERLVACFEKIVDSRLDQRPHLAEARLREANAIFGPQARVVTRSEIAEVCAAWRSMQARWDSLAVGDGLRIDWPAARIRSRAAPAEAPQRGTS